MKSRSLSRILIFVAFLLAIGLACNAVSGGSEVSGEEPPAQPVIQEPTVQQAPTEEVVVEEPPQTVEEETGGFVLFTDQNDLYSIEVPADWFYEQTYDSENNYYYIDTFSSPDGGAIIENIVYDDGTPFTGKQKGRFALYLLNTFYSSTGREGDIRVSDDKIMPDGSERLTWTSQGGGYSGISFLEVRSNDTTFLLFTVNWGNNVQDDYIDTLNYVIDSYSIP